MDQVPPPPPPPPPSMNGVLPPPPSLLGAPAPPPPPRAPGPPCKGRGGEKININPLRWYKVGRIIMQGSLWEELQRQSPPELESPGTGPCKWRCEHEGHAVEKSNLKPLQWNKVTRAMTGSLWEELQRQSPTELDVSELETLFSNAPPKKAAPKDADKKNAEKKKAASSKPKKVQLIDSRRATNTETMLRNLKMSYPKMVDAVLAMNDTLLDVDQVENILKLFPTKEEVYNVKIYAGDLEKLGLCEQYFMELMRVPRMEAKLNIFLFKIQFSSQLADLRNILNIVNHACDEVRKSTRLKEIMKRILYLGNALNQGTARCSAVGFKLDSLLKLTDTRASNSRMTLMHYLCRLLATKSPLLLEFKEDLGNLEAASKIQLKSLAEEMQALILRLTKAKKEHEHCLIYDGPLSDRFDMGKNADGLALYFGEDPARCPYEQATQTLCDFVRLFLECHEDNLKQAELEGKKAEMEQANGANLPIQIMETVDQ